MSKYDTLGSPLVATVRDGLLSFFTFFIIFLGHGGVYLDIFRDILQVLIHYSPWVGCKFELTPY